MTKRIAALLLVALAGCDAGATDLPLDLVDASLLVEVEGGLAGADYAYAVTPKGVVVAERCRALCDFKAGDTLHVLSALQEQELAHALDRAGAREVTGVQDHGVPCCDHFVYVLTFENGGRQGVVRGAAPALPEPYRKLVALLERLRQGIAPVVVLDGPPVEGYPADLVVLGGATLDPPYLVLETRYGGGCGRHDLDVVVLPAWRESYPVQVDLDLAHEDHDDPCDALVDRTVRFDLTPLAEAYGARYGTGPGALELHLAPASGGQRQALRWEF